MNKIYLAEYCPDAYEDTYKTISVHRTYGGAEKAMESHKEKILQEFPDLSDKDKDDVLSSKAWRITEMDLLN